MLYRESESMVKSTKLLVHYIHYFSEIKNIVFRVHSIYKGQHAIGEDIYKSEDWQPEIAITVAKPLKIKQNKETGDREFIPNTHDLTKLCAILELCPDICLDDKRIVSDTNCSYRIDKVNYSLNWIKSDFYK